MANQLTCRDDPAEAKGLQNALCYSGWIDADCLVYQSCKSGMAFRVGFGPKVDQNFGLNWNLRRTFCIRCIGGHGTLQKYRGTGTGTFKLKVPQ